MTPARKTRVAIPWHRLATPERLRCMSIPPSLKRILTAVAALACIVCAVVLLISPGAFADCDTEPTQLRNAVLQAGVRVPSSAAAPRDRIPALDRYRSTIVALHLPRAYAAEEHRLLRAIDAERETAADRRGRLDDPVLMILDHQAGTARGDAGRSLTDAFDIPIGKTYRERACARAAER